VLIKIRDNLNLDPSKNDDSVNWVHFSEPQFALQSNEWKVITATIDVPAYAAFGYYFAFTFSRDGAASPAADGTTQLSGSTAILVLLDVLVPGAKRTAEIASFTTDRSFYEYLPASLKVTIHNTGNVHIAPRGNIFIDRGSQDQVGLLEVNPDQGNILPDSNRTFEIPWNDGFPHYEDVIQSGKVQHDKDGGILTHLLWKLSDITKLRVGRYTASLVMTYDDGTRDVPLEAKVSFWVIPWRLLIGIHRLVE
jgi:hypothetical protein